LITNYLLPYKEKLFDLGNKTFAKSPDEAMDIFLRREFPEIEGLKTGSSHSVRFIPDTYIYKGLTEKVSGKILIIDYLIVMFKIVVWSSWT